MHPRATGSLGLALAAAASTILLACSSVDSRTPILGASAAAGSAGAGDAQGGSGSAGAGGSVASGAAGVMSTSAGSNAAGAQAGASSAGTSGEGGAGGDETGGAHAGGSSGEGAGGSPSDPQPTPGACSGPALVNQGFEQGTSGWTLFSSGPDPVIYEQSDPQNVEYGVPAQEGTRLVWLGGAASLTERLTQAFTLPATASALSLSFFYRIRTNNPSVDPQDQASVTLTAGGDEIASLLTLSNLTGNSDGWQAVATTVNVQEHAGSSLTLVFEGTQQTDGTSFFFDGLQTTIECTP